jgi:glycosyltransferase involved in cell wall biosynthesis
MKPLYLASLYYDNEIVSGANKRFDGMGKCFVSRLGDSFKTIVCESQRPPWVREENCIFVPPFSSNLQKLKSFLHFGHALRKLEAGTVINDFIPIPFMALRKHAHFQLIHDFRDFTEYKRDQLPLTAPLILCWELRRCQKIITVSEASKRDGIERCGLRADKVVRSYNGIDSAHGVKFQDTERNIDLLYVSTFEARKNHKALLQALALIDQPLKVTFIGRDHGLRPAMKELANAIHKKTGTAFDFIDRIDEQDLVGIYQRTRTYVCPSVLEGFGMPLVEALAANCRIACSDIPVFREVCQEHALYFDPHDPDDMAGCLRKSLAMSPPTNAQQYAEKFSWDTITDDLLRDIGYSC